MKKLLPSLLAMTTFASLAATPAATAITGGQPAQHPRTLFFAGASTLDEHGGDESKFASWGSSLRPFLREGCAIVNYGRSGRSTTSFIREGWWGKIVEALNPGDFVIVQFGHNDQKLDKPDVATPIPQYKENLRRMAADVREKGATPVFATPIVRLTYGQDGLLTDHQHLDDWAEAMREVAKEDGVDLVDMREMTRKAANDAGEEEALTWNAPGDRTHPAVKGARRYAQLFLHDAKRRGLAVAGLFIDVAAAAPGVALSVVEKRPGYNSWPMIQAVGNTLVCAYSRGLQHTTGDGGRGTFARVSRDGGATWGDPICIADSPEWGECAAGKGIDASGAMLLWVRRQDRGGWDTGTFHDLFRSFDGLAWEKTSSPSLDPAPIQITDVFHLPGGAMMSLWFSGNYRDESKNAWGTLTSRDGGRTWEQRTVESGIPKAEWPTEPSAVVLPDGRILAVSRTEVSRAGQLQLLSADGGETWTKKRTNITDVSASTPSLILDAARGLVHCYYFERGPGLLKRRTARVADIFADPASWPEPEVLALGGKVRPHDSGNANATAIGDRHFIAYYAGDPTNAAVAVAATKAPEQSP
ncbi:MAG: exo-alpha-sialidase [Kiritimatiellae bacterium]|nr:exo-alpha-sialidase [Kiritimatiellia bacterium]